MGGTKIARLTIRSGQGYNVEEGKRSAQTKQHRSVGRMVTDAKTRKFGVSSPAAPKVQQVNFVFFDAKAQSVCVAGAFNDWNPRASPLRSMGAGEWCLQLLLEPGRYEYLFLVDGQWRMDPLARQQVTDFCGSVKSVLVVE